MRTKPQVLFALVLLAAMMAAERVEGARRRHHDSQPQTAKVLKPDTVESVDAAAFTIKVASGQKNRTISTYTVTAFTKIFVDGKPAKLEDVKKGMRVTVVSTDGKSAARIEAAEYAGGDEKKEPQKDNKKKK